MASNFSEGNQLGQPRASRNKLLSVIVPTCHRNDLLAKCLDCLKPEVQTLPISRYEVIVTDDGTKSTAQGMIANQFPWAKWVAGPHRGPAANRNHAVSVSSGDWLVFTDDDCLPTPSWLQNFVEAVVDDTYVYEGRTTCDAGLRSPLDHAPVNLTGGLLWSCNLMVSKDAFDKIDGFDANYHYPHMEDVDFRDRLCDRNFKTLFVPEALVDHPPRRLAWGTQLARMNESRALYMYKRGHKGPLAKTLVVSIIMSRLQKIVRRKLSADSFIALVSLLVEAYYTALRAKKWEQKYAVEFISKDTAK